MSVRAKDFKYIPGKNDDEYIKLLKETLERQKQITNKAIAKIKELSNCSEFPTSWIPCTPEAMPKDGQNVLVSYKTSEIIHVCQYHNDGSANPWYSYIDQCRAYMNVVTAWMPLPKPYGGERE